MNIDIKILNEIWQIKLSIFADVIPRKPKKNAAKLLKINTFSKVAGCKINTQILIAFFYINNNQIKNTEQRLTNFVRDQIVNIFDFGGRVISVTTTQFCHCGTKTARRQVKD